MEFDWNDANIEHIDAHSVDPVEAEEAVLDEAARALTSHRGPTGEPRTAYVGATSEGRLLFVVVTVRNGALRVITARNATPRERTLYWS